MLYKIKITALSLMIAMAALSVHKIHSFAESKLSREERMKFLKEHKDFQNTLTALRSKMQTIENKEEKVALFKEFIKNNQTPFDFRISSRSLREPLLDIDFDKIKVNPQSLQVAFWPEENAQHALKQLELNNDEDTLGRPQKIGLNFTGVTGSDAPTPLIFTPPDTMGAVGPTQFIMFMNNGMVSFDKKTGKKDHVLDVAITSFFNSPIPEGVFDVRIRFDKQTNRWFVVGIDFPPSGANNIYVGVSDGLNGGTITKCTKWFTTSFPQDQPNPSPSDTGNFADQPTLGIDKHALYIGVNIFTADLTAFIGNTVFVIQKKSLIENGPLVVTAFRDLTTESGIFGAQGVDNFDHNAQEGHFFGANGNVFNELVLYRIFNPGSTNPTISSPITVTVPTFAIAPNAPHKGNLFDGPGLIETQDPRLSNAQIRDNQLFTSHTIGVNKNGVSHPPFGNRAAIRWYQFDISNPAVPQLVQSGTLFDPAEENPRFFYEGSLMNNKRGDLVIGATTSAKDQFIDTVFAGRLATDPLGTLRKPTLLTHSQDAYNLFPSAIRGGQRWGDYSYTSLDPEDELTFWTIQEFTAAPSVYGLQITQLLSPE